MVVLNAFMCVFLQFLQVMRYRKRFEILINVLSFFSTIVICLNLLRYFVLIIVPNVMLPTRNTVSLRALVSGGHSLPVEVIFRTDTTGRRAITLFFLL